MSGAASAVGRDDADFVIDMKTVGGSLFDKLDHLRETEPIFWSEKNQAWMVTGHAEVAEGYFGTLPLSSVRLPFLAVAHVPEEDRMRLFPHVVEAPKTWL